MTDPRVVVILFILLCAESAALFPWPRMHKEGPLALRDVALHDRPPMPDFVPVRPYRTTPTQQFKHAPTGRDLKALPGCSLARMSKPSARASPPAESLAQTGQFVGAG